MKPIVRRLLLGGSFIVGLFCLFFLVTSANAFLDALKAINDLQVEIGDLAKENRKSLEILKSAVLQPNAVRVTVSSYTNAEVTASRIEAFSGIAAVSRDLVKENGFFPGKRVWLEGIGIYRIEDVIGPGRTRQIYVWQDPERRQFVRSHILAVVMREER